MKTILIHLWLVIIVCFVSCETETAWELQKDNFQKIVVDGTITNKFKAHKISLHYTTRGINETPVPVTGATMAIIYELDTILCTESADSQGIYFTQPFSALKGYHYTLVFKSGDFVDFSTAVMPEVSKLKPIQIAAIDTLFRYFYTGSNAPCMMEVIYNWSHDTAYSTIYGHTTASELFFTLNNIDVSEVFAPGKQGIYFPLGTKITRHKYSLSEKHQEYLRHLLLETEWRGGFFDVEPGNIPSYFENGTLGFFGASMVLSDSLVYLP